MNDVKLEGRDVDSITPFSKKTGGWLRSNSSEKVVSSGKMFSQKSREGNPSVSSTQEDSQMKSLSGLRNFASNDMNKVANSQLNEKEQNFNEKLCTLGSINLTPLTRFLSPKEDLKEDSVPWTWDSLFTEVASKLRADWEKSKSEDL